MAHPPGRTRIWLCDNDLVSAMKVTVSAAMRARDVSRPHAEHLAYAEAAEASSRPTGPAAPADAGFAADTALAADTAVPMDVAPRDETLGETRGEDRAGRPGGGRRRFRSRGAGRGRASR